MTIQHAKPAFDIEQTYALRDFANHMKWAIMMPDQTSGKQAKAENAKPTGCLLDLVRILCIRCDPASRGWRLFGSAVGSTWWNRCVSTARFIEPQSPCVLNRVESHVTESLPSRCYYQASRRSMLCLADSGSLFVLNLIAPQVSKTGLAGLARPKSTEKPRFPPCGVDQGSVLARNP